MRVVLLLARAKEDIDEVLGWLSQRSPAGAATWHEALMQRLAALGSGTFLGSSAPESKKLRLDLRQVFFRTRRGRTYRALFLVYDQEIRFLRVRGPGQKPVGRRDIPAQE
jgi:plasmid stabilization system protein ParE